TATVAITSRPQAAKNTRSPTSTSRNPRRTFAHSPPKGSGGGASSSASGTSSSGPPQEGQGDGPVPRSSTCTDNPHRGHEASSPMGTPLEARPGPLPVRVVIE